jgi:hypothetical protein
MTYHGGPILPTTTVQAIFWGSSWPTYTGDEISGMNKWYSGVSGTSYAATVDEYTDSSGHQVSSSISYSGYIVDGSSVPKHVSTSAVLGEVCKVVTKPVTNAYYPVYVDKARGGANYCAYHSWGSCNGTAIEFGFFFKPDGDSGCNPGSTVSGQSEGLAASSGRSRGTGRTTIMTTILDMRTPADSTAARTERIIRDRTRIRVLVCN